jgi:predicted PurR-regulated permease PerM
MVRRDYFQTGFSLALGAVVLLILLYVGWQFLLAVMAIVTPFVGAVIISLLLDPLVVRIQKRFASNDRNKAVLIVFALFMICFLGLIAFLVPNLIVQTARLVSFFAPVTYRLERAPAEGGRWLTIAEEFNATNYTVRNLTNGQAYQFRVTAKDAEGHVYELPLAAATPQDKSTNGNGDAPPPTPTPSPDAVPTPVITPEADLLPARPFPETPSPAPDSPANRRQEQIQQGVDASSGVLTVIPGDGEVKMFWKPPSTVRSQFERLRATVDNWLLEHRKIGPISLPANIEALQSQYSAQISRALQQAATRFANIVTESASKLLTLVLIPILTFYILADMARLRARFLFLLPDGTRRHFLRVANDIGGSFSGYLRGMFTLSVLYGIIGTVIYFAFGLNAYALLLGFVAGLLYAVPFIGPLITLSLVAIISLAAGLPIVKILVLLAVSFGQNMVFDNFLTPRVVGKSVGLHPITTMFSLFLGGQLFGLLGMLFAVPLAASVQLSLTRLFPKLGEPVPLSVLLEGPEAEDKKVVEEISEGRPSETVSATSTPIIVSPSETQSATAPREASATLPAAPEPPGKSPYSMD